MAGLIAWALLAHGCREQPDVAGGPRLDGGAAAPVEPRWPALPADSVSARALVDRAGRRQVEAASPQLSARGLRALIERQHRRGRLRAGWEAVLGALQRELDRARDAGRPVWLLFGGYHDSALQVRAFGRLVSPMGLEGIEAVGLEALDAGGRWQGVPDGEQAGDDQALLAYLSSGQRRDFQDLLRGQLRTNYTAWKYGYLAELMDLLVSARAQGRELAGCDMPDALQKRIRALGDDLDLRLRELHCALALRARGLERSSMAMLWGQAHAGPEGLARFVDPAVQLVAVRAFGGRAASSGLERELGQELKIAEPVLVPQEGADRAFVLLLPGAQLGAACERRRLFAEQPLEPARAQQLELASTRPGTLVLPGGRELELGSKTTSQPLALGEHAYIFQTEQIWLLGNLPMPRGGRLELEIDPDEPRLAITRISPPSEADAP